MAERDEKGRFVAGNKAAAGHARPHAAKIAKLRATLFDVVTPENMRGVLIAMLKAAMEGDVAAARLILSYGIGAPEATDVLERIEGLEEALKCD